MTESALKFIKHLQEALVFTETKEWKADHTDVKNVTLEAGPKVLK